MLYKRVEPKKAILAEYFVANYDVITNIVSWTGGMYTMDDGGARCCLVPRVGAPTLRLLLGDVLILDRQWGWRKMGARAFNESFTETRTDWKGLATEIVQELQDVDSQGFVVSPLVLHLLRNEPIVVNRVFQCSAAYLPWEYSADGGERRKLMAVLDLAG